MLAELHHLTPQTAMPLPHFLIIGAMKSGTTTLYDDLRQHPSVFFPLDKEPSFLCKLDAEHPDKVDEYRKLFRKAKPDQLCGEASTAYTKRPTYEGVAERAKAVLGQDLKIIYIVRDPIKRIISHHHHDCASKLCGQDIDKEVFSHPVMVDYSRYAYQLETWVEVFGRTAVLVLKFEDYMSQRQAEYDRVCSWLGLERNTLENPKKQMNSSIGKPYHTGLWTVFLHSPIYRKLLRPLLSNKFKTWASYKLLPRTKMQHVVPSEKTIRYLISQLKDDNEKMTEIMGTSTPPWDLSQHLQASSSKPSSIS